MILTMILAAAASAAAQTFVLVGDSTVNDEGGWGPGFAASFSTAKTLNHASNGRSSKSFIDEGRWAKALADKPDYVLIQFGHNDQPGKGPERETDPQTTYKTNLRQYVNEARAAGATPIIVTSITRRHFGEDGKLSNDGLHLYVQAAREAAKEMNAPLVDLNALTIAQTEKLGEKGSAALGAKTKDGKLDTTHLSQRGQLEIGVLAAQETARVVPALKPLLQEVVSWNEAQRKKGAWLASPEAIRVAENLLIYQHDNGAWDKNIDMAMPLGEQARKKLIAEKSQNAGRTTIDNGATYSQMRYLAKVHEATRQERYAEAYRAGLRYLLSAQYPNGGWPQFFPLRKGYYTHITYNDDAMIGVMEELREAEKLMWVPEKDRSRARQAVEKGIEIILKTQVKVNGKLTAWCAQHDENTLAPAKARSYELPSLSGSESVGVVRFLMSLDRPSPDVIRAVESAVAWFEASKVTGIRLDRKPEPESPKGYDLVVVPDASAPPQWARFYDLATNTPMFCGRDGVVKTKLSEIEYERRNGYRWYVDRPAKLLAEDYPKWRAKNKRI